MAGWLRETDSFPVSRFFPFLSFRSLPFPSFPDTQMIEEMFVLLPKTPRLLLVMIPSSKQLQPSLTQHVPPSRRGREGFPITMMQAQALTMTNR